MNALDTVIKTLLRSSKGTSEQRASIYQKIVNTSHLYRNIRTPVNIHSYWYSAILIILLKTQPLVFFYLSTTIIGGPGQGHRVPGGARFNDDGQNGYDKRTLIMLQEKRRAMTASRLCATNSY